MDETQFLAWMKTLYGTFGKPPPQAHVVEAAYRRVEGLPDRFFAYALDRLQEREALPQNLGRDLRVVLWPDFLSAHPELRSRAGDCPECNGDGAIIVTLADPKGRQGHGKTVGFQCVCKVGDAEGWTRDRIIERGYQFEKPAPRRKAREGLARLGIRLGEIDDARAEQRTGHLPDTERGEVLAW